MKNLLPIIMLVLIAQTVTAQSVPSYVPTNGLVGWWPFNGNANDESGNGNNGTIVAGVSNTTDRFGTTNSAYLFDGINGRIDLPTLNNLPYRPITYSAWVIVNSYLPSSFGHKFRAIIGRNTAFITDNGVIGFYADKNTFNGLYDNTFIMWRGGGVAGDFPTTSVIPPINSWIHVVYTQEINGNWKWYQNGLIVNSGTFTDLQNDFNYFQIGACNNQSTGNTYWNDKLDDIGIWNRALTQQEITNLYNASTTPPTPCPTLPANLQTGLVGYWPFCGNANDESGNGNNGTVNGATLTSDRFGNAGKAYSFDGVNDFIMVQDNNKLNPNSLTISGWTNSNSISSFAEPNALVTKWNQISNCGGDGENYGVYLNVINNKNILYCNTSRNSQFSNSLQTINDLLGFNNWKHFVFTHDSNYGQKLFIDGVQINSNNITGNLCATTNNLYFGADKQNSSLWRFLSGSLDDICIWNRALDSSEISQLYQTQSSDANNGNVGVNVIAPQRNLHIKDVIRLEPRNTPPDNPVFGDMYIDAVLKKLRVYDGTTWQNCW